MAQSLINKENIIWDDEPDLKRENIVWDEEPKTFLQSAGKIAGDMAKGLGLSVPAGLGETVASGAKVTELSSELTGGDKGLRPWWFKYIPDQLIDWSVSAPATIAKAVNPLLPEEYRYQGKIPTAKEVKQPLEKGASDILYQAVQPFEEEAKTFSKPGQFAYTIGKPVANIALTGGTGSLLSNGLRSAAAKGIVKLTPFALSAAGSYAKEAELDGATPLQQAAYGTVMGIAEAATEKIPFDEWFKIAGGKAGIKSWIKSMGVEGLQELIMDPVSAITKKFVYNQNIPWIGRGGVIDPVQMGQSFIGGVGTGALMSGGAASVNALNRFGDRMRGVSANKEAAPSVQSVQVEEVTPGAESISEKLQNATRSMTPDQVFDSVYRSSKAGGILNEAAYREAMKNPKPFQTAIDLDGMKEVNDTFGHQGGDKYIEVFGEALKETGLEDVFHLHGDEFAVQGNSVQELQVAMEKVNSFMNNVIMEMEDLSGNVRQIPFGGFSYGIGSDSKQADAALYRHKAEREAAGLRRGRRSTDQPAEIPLQSGREGSLQERSARVTDHQVYPPERQGDFVRQGLEPVQTKQSEPVFSSIEVTGQEFGENLESKELRKAAIDYYKANLRGKTVVHPELGEVKFSSTGMGKMIATSADVRKIKVVPKLRELITTAKIASIEENKKKDIRPNVRRYIYLTNQAILEGKPANVGITLFEDNNGNIYYNHNIVEEAAKNQKTSSVSPGVVRKDRTTPAYNEVFKDSIAPDKQKSNPRGNADRGGYADRMSPPLNPETAWDYQSRTYNGDDKQRSDVYAERPRSMVELPEIVEIAKELNEGKAPQVKEKLGNALGYFSSRGESGNIKLRADIFKDQGKAAKVLAHEIGHMVDWLPDKTMKRGNILGRIASLKSYMKHTLPEKPGAAGELTPKDRARLRREAERFVKNAQAVENEDIGISPKDIIAVWNDVSSKENNPELYEYITKLSTAEKKQILKDAFRGEVNFSLPNAEYRKWGQTVKEKYQELIKKEIVKRKLYEYETVRDELKAVSQEWKPFNESNDPRYTKYRYSPEELYADAISVLFNEPELLRTKAPNFYRGFFNYLESKPEVKRIYDEIQDRLINPEEVGWRRIEGVYEMLEKGNESRDIARQNLEQKVLSFPDTLAKWLVDKDWPLLKRIKQAEKQGGDYRLIAEKARFELEETKYMAAEANDYINTLEQSVMDPLQEAGLSIEDMGAYMLAKRAATDRATIANPRGLDETAAKRMLNDLKGRVGKGKFSKLEKIVETYRGMREDLVFPQTEKSGMYSPELIDLMKSSKNYARFNVQHYLEKQYGGQGSARVYRQIGTLADIENPFISTVVQDISMLRAAKMNTAKKATIDLLKSIGEASPVDRVFSKDVGGMIAKEPRDPTKALLSVLKDGKMESFVVDKEITKSFERQPFEATKVAEFFSALTRPIKEILVSKNPIWMARNVIRDVKATVKNVPEVRFRDIPKLAGYYNRAFREVANEVFKGERSEDISSMYKGYMLNPNRVYSGKDVTFENEIERLVNEFQVSTRDHMKAIGIRGRLKRAWEYLDRFGRVSELTGKVAGYKYLKNETNLTNQQIGHTVRTRIGTPDARRQGAAHQVTNSIFMFSNINKEGFRSALEAYRMNRGRYIWKTAMMNILPKLVLIGAMAAGDDELKRLLEKIPEYDKRMYDVIPLCLTKNGKAMYLRIPQDYDGQFFGVVTWLLSKGKFTGVDSIANTIAETSPYQLNPIIQVASDLFTYYAKGQNPTDDYRGAPIIPRKAFTAGRWDAHQVMIKHAWKNLGGSVIYNPGDYSDRNTEPIEKLLKMPGLNVLGSFLKISDKGEMDAYYEEKDIQDREKARRSLQIEKRVIESVKAKGDKMPTRADMIKLYHELRKEKLIPKDESIAQFRTRRYLRYAAKAIPDQDIRMILRASSNAEREALLKTKKQDMTRLQYTRLRNDLRRLGVDIGSGY